MGVSYRQKRKTDSSGGNLRINRDLRTVADRLATCWTISDGSKPAAARDSERRDASIQFHRWELNGPVKLLINRAFLNVVVMGTIERELYAIDK